MAELPKPYVRRRPSPVTVRRVDAEDEQVVPPDHFGPHSRPSLYSYGWGSVRVEPSPSFDLLADQELLALKPGAVVCLGDDEIHLHWFVQDVNGIDRTITVVTVMVGQIQQRTVPFHYVEVALLDDQERATAERAYREIDQPLSQRVNTAGEGRNRTPKTQRRRRR